MHFPVLFRGTLLVVAAPVVVVACGGEDSPGEVTRPVRYAQVFTSGGTRTRTFSGVAHSRVESRLSFRVSGRVQRLAVQVGDSVAAGQLIGALDPADYRLQVEEAQASLARARAQERNARANFERVRQLYENANASPTDLDAARSAFESAQAQARAIENALGLARLQLSYARLVAPAAGRIAEVSVEVNENVQAGQGIVTLTSGAELDVAIAIPEVLIARVREGDAVSVNFDALPDRTFPARVTEVGVIAGALATAYPVTVRLERAAAGLRPGMAAEVSFRFESPDQRERIIVPPVAVGEDRDGRHVFVVQRVDSLRGIALRRPVVVGELTEEGLEILEGLVDGELVVTAGVSRVRDSLLVRLPRDPS